MCPEDQLRAREFVELHDQVQTSVNLLDSLEGFLSTFQKDLSAVSGQISNLQDRSKDIDNRLKGRRRIEKPLSNLISDLCIPPALATLILDTRVDDDWIPAIVEFERRLETLKLRVRVKAARDLSEVAEGLRIVAATKLRTFFLAMLEPIRTSMTTNLQMLQSSVWMKYRPLFVFLQRHASNVASEVQRAYVSSVRTFYETGFRRYLRGLGWVKARTVEKSESIISGAGETSQGLEFDANRLSYARVDGPSVTMAYMTEDKNYKEPLEALVRSALMVLMDNATAEYAFITSFFANEPRPPPQSRDQTGSAAMSPPILSPTRGEFDELRSGPGSEIGSDSVSPRMRPVNITSVIQAAANQEQTAKEEQAALNALWKQVIDPILDYCSTFVAGAIEPPPPVIPLLTIIRLTEDIVAEVQRRGCGPLETYIFTLRLKMWPVFQKLMAEHVDALKKFAEGASAGYFRRSGTTDAAVSSVCRRYVTIFNSFVALTDQPEETMIFSNLLRLRQELSKLITTHTDKLGDQVAKASAQSTFYEQILQGLSNGPHPASHPKAQSELAYWRQRDEESRRRVVSTHGRR
ncbi:vacuolar sorting protein [Dichomitus squalens]|uniref:Vacuolar sorting protein n=2 Tax=Dichomitus squalens TaxID=114155 RepID=A0A4V2K9I4_9APHY|nr:vacuolar sorting protein [Dichomitus squalens LYAD-421 SS1]EJF61135.1 vacuolar sorting protein [Dichomitus squalens LYAD-421 SS1]TBU49384.1 vacuolar sorting protein [Dichomitus squalens]TBU64018.1 vacuolar sorting protein [Dichomitus squalens]